MEEKIKNIIIKKEGTFIEFIKVKKGKTVRRCVKFLCENNHVVEKRCDSYYSYPDGWCKLCLKNTLNDCHKLAEKMNLIFLSTKYIDANTKYKWKCKNEHTFEAKYSNVYVGRGCRQCLMIPFETIVRLAKSKKGNVLTKKEDYINTNYKIELQCKEGHKWFTLYSRIKNGTWCPKCQESVCERTCRKILEYIYKEKFPKKRPEFLKSNKNGRMEYDGYCETLQVAFEFNGRQHYMFIKYWHKTQERFEQHKLRDIEKNKISKERGINLITIPYTIKYENLYQYIKLYCNIENLPENIDYEILNIKGLNRDRLETVRDCVKEKWEGVLLSDKYVNSQTKMDFECSKGHKFKQNWSSINIGIFCKRCTYNMDDQIHDFEENNNMKLLDEYKNIIIKMKWQCTICDKIILATWKSLRIRKTKICC